MQGHLAHGVGRAAQAGIKSPDTMFNPVQRPLAQCLAVEISLGNLFDRFVHGHIILPGGNDQVDPLEETVIIHLILMEECPPRGLAHANP